jgi:DNA gyrase subunit B
MVRGVGTYSADELQVGDGVQHVRARPDMYVGDVGPKGLHRLACVPLHNAMDEAASARVGMP